MESQLAKQAMALAQLHANQVGQQLEGCLDSRAVLGDIFHLLAALLTIVGACALPLPPHSSRRPLPLTC